MERLSRDKPLELSPAMEGGAIAIGCVEHASASCYSKVDDDHDGEMISEFHRNDTVIQWLNSPTGPTRASQKQKA